MRKDTNIHITPKKTKYNLIRRIYNRIVFLNPDSCLPINIDEYIKENNEKKYCAFPLLKR